ncbi:MAG: FAD-dependent thymidylate synthase [Deltaproteobacteria bacterium]|nr:FAD-dependent thymidylate synthase [Deltaproteobacteria bacterium]
MQKNPIVKLEAVIQDPYDLAVATARTCYSAKGIIRVPDLHKSDRSLALRDKISQSTREAGHLTTRQHAHFVFSLDQVSRQFLWSFLHSHPFYNSEQVSQRYVKVEPGRYTVPPMPENAEKLFHEIVTEQISDYHQLIESLLPKIRQEYYEIFPIRKKWEEKYEKTVLKKAYEVARYALPVAIHAYLYHTISALTLMRYHRLMDYFDTPWEQRQVVQQMVDCVLQHDPDFARELNDPIAIEQSPEYQLLQKHFEQKHLSQEFITEFDQSLAGKKSRLIDYKINAPQTLAQAVRSTLGLPKSALSDTDALARLLDPAQNPSLGDTLNINSLSKLNRCLFHAHYTFRKKISHTADSQDQRHRMVPASRPILESQFTGKPDFITPKIVEEHAQAQELYLSSMKKTFAGIEKLFEMGVSQESALYLLPNAFPIRFEESGDLLNLHHKWHARACYTAQEEIFYATVDELQEVSKVHPQITEHILAPCYIRKRAGIKPICPEGDRFCGVKVWQQDIAEYKRVI